MAGILPEEACLVSVMHMVDPGTFWVAELPDKDMTEERRELSVLEESLQAMCRHSSFYNHGCYMPEKGEMVAVEHPKTYRWHRGKVEGVLNKVTGYVYSVFLVDHGESLQVRSSSMQELPASCESLGHQAMQVVLYGVVPVTRELEYERSNMKTMVLDHWTGTAFRFVKEFLEKCVKAYIVYVKNINNVIYGDLYLELKDGSVISLKNVLCENEYAIFNEELFDRGCEEDETSPCRSPKPDSVKSQCHSILEYINEYNDKKKMREKDTLDKIEQWRHHNKLFEHEKENSDEDAPLGRGMSLRTRSQIIPGRMTEKQQNTPCDSSVTKSPDKSLLDFLDMICDVGEDAMEPAKSCSHPIDSCKPLPSEASNSISYMPAGAMLKSNTSTSANDLSHNKPSYHTNITSKPEKNFKKSSSVQMKLIGNSRINSKTEKFKSLLSVTNAVDDKSEHNKKIKENSTDFKKLSEHTIFMTLEHLNATDDGKANKLNKVSSQDSVREYNNKLTENSTDSKKLSIDEVNLAVNSKEQGSQENVSLATARPLSLFERLQEKKKTANRKSDDMMQNIMDGVIKSSKSKSQVQLNSLKSSEKRSGTLVTDEHHLKTVMGLLDLMDMLDGPNPAMELPVSDKLMDKSSAARLLVHGDMRSHPIQSVADANFPPEIHEALREMDLKSPMRIQMYAWPAIMRGQYTILIGPPRSGKTLSYIVPVISFMLTPDMYSELPPGNGPLVLVLCSGSKSAEFIYEKCCSLLQAVKHMEVRVQLALGGSCEVDLRDQLANGCDILVSTPLCLLRLLGSSHLITNLDRLAHLVVDEVDILADKFLPEVKKILGECKHILKQRAKVAVSLQLIAASEKWCPAVEQFSQHVSQDFVICISGHLEAAVYAKLRPTLHYLSSSDKVHTLLDILDGVRGLYKILVVCKDAAEVGMLEPFLLSQCFSVVAVHEDSRNRGKYQHWKNCVSGNYPVLVCSDDVLHELDVHDAMWLIHYSLPPTKTRFGFRFSSLMDNYSSVFHKSSANDDDPDCTVHIFIDKDGDNKELPEVVELMKRLSIPVRPELEARAAVSMKQQESQKSSAPLCLNMKAFGACLEKTNCPNRHVVLSVLDKPVNIPRHGTVKLKILYVLDASRFATRLLQYKDENGSTVQVSDDYFTITMAVLKHYSNERNRGLHGVPKLGDICGLENKINTFQRVQVTQITRQDEKNVPEEVRVYFLDEGIYNDVKVYQLLSLPSHLQQLPSQTVEVFLCNVIPCDMDPCWSQEASYRMSSWIRNITVGETQGRFMVGKIVLSLGNTLWLDPLNCCSHLETVDTHVTEVSLRMELLKSKLAVENPKHMNNLLTMCREAHMYVPTYSPVERRPAEHKTVLPAPQWAHLPSDGYQTVFFICAVDPHKFHVRRHDFDKCFQELVADIQDCVKTKLKDFHVEKGSLCIGKFPGDGIWYRASVDEIFENKSVSLFFVDHGDFASVSMDDIAPITHKLITKLPFQAIECSLAGVKPVSGDIWSEDATDVLYDFTDNNPIVHVKVCGVLEQEHCVGGKKYQVLCVDTNTQEDIVLNQLLVEKNLAISDNTVKLEEEIILERGDSSDESDIEIDSCVVKLSDACKEVRLSDIRPEEDSEDEYDIVMNDVELFIKEMLGLDKLEQSMSPPSVGTSRFPALPPARNSTMHRTSSIGSLSSGCLSDEECIPPLASHTKIPEVLWYQDYCTVGMKIRLTGVDQYYLSWDLINFNFRTDLNHDVYEVAGELFGPIIPSQLSHSAKGLYVHIKMKKAVCGFTWPCLFNSKNRKPWLKYDLDMLKEDCGIFLQNRDLGKLPGVQLKEWEKVEIIPELVDTDEEEEDDDDNDDGPEVFEVIDTLYDPFDPLN